MSYSTVQACDDYFEGNFGKNNGDGTPHNGRAANRPRKVAGQGDKRFLRREELIHRGLEDALAKRRIGVKVSELCERACIAGSTFYLHYKSCDEALLYYEITLEEAFARTLEEVLARIPYGAAQREVTLTILMKFVAQHRRYFRSALHGWDMCLLARLVKCACRQEEQGATNVRVYFLYLRSVEAMIWCWGVCDGFSAAKMESYLKKLLALRLMNYGL